MEVGVVMAGSSCGLQDDNVADIELDRSTSVENVIETGIARSHEWTEQCGVATNNIDLNNYTKNEKKVLVFFYKS